MRSEDRLAALLEEREAEANALREEARTLEHALRGSGHGWSLPRDLAGDDPALPVPRLELGWTPDVALGWRDYTVEYRLVVRHLTGGLKAIPLGLTRSSGGNGRAPWEQSDGVALHLPFRDGAHAHHDAAHLGLPLYAVTPDGAVRLDAGDDYPRQRERGRAHRREAQ